MLYFKINGKAVLWNYEMINNIRYPSNIEFLWSDDELAAVGLYRPLPADSVPEGKIAVGETVTVVRGKVKVVLTLEDEPIPEPPSTDPADYPLSMRQLRLGLLANDFPVNFIQDVITGLVWAEDDPRWSEFELSPSPEQIAVARTAQAGNQARAQIWYEETSVVEWDHPMTQQLIVAAGLTTEQAGTMWMQAKDLDV